MSSSFTDNVLIICHFRDCSYLKLYEMMIWRDFDASSRKKQPTSHQYRPQKLHQMKRVNVMSTSAGVLMSCEDKASGPNH